MLYSQTAEVKLGKHFYGRMQTENMRFLNVKSTSDMDSPAKQYTIQFVMPYSVWSMLERMLIHVTPCEKKCRPNYFFLYIMAPHMASLSKSYLKHFFFISIGVVEAGGEFQQTFH